MTDVVVNLSVREVSQIAAIARDDGDVIGRIDPASVEDMAGALLRAYLLLIADCGGILPERKRALVAAPRADVARLIGKGGVSLGGGINAPL